MAELDGMVGDWYSKARAAEILEVVESQIAAARRADRLRTRLVRRGRHRHIEVFIPRQDRMLAWVGGVPWGQAGRGHRVPR